MSKSVLAELEHAELAARERRLAAVVEAEQRVVAAAAAAAAVRSGIDAAIVDALDALRREHRERAAAAVAAIEGELAALDRPVEADAVDPDANAAVELVVAAVLGEPEA